MAVKGKAGKLVTKKVVKELKEAETGGKVVAGAELIDAVFDSPTAQAVLGAAEGAALGGAVAGPFGAIGGGLAGGAIGFFMADGERIVPVDMVAIPAFEYSNVQRGLSPTFMLYIKEGEIVMPIRKTDFMQSAQTVQGTEKNRSVKRKTAKLSKWQKYVKNKRNHIKFKSGKNKGRLNLKAMAKKFKSRGKK